MGFRNPITTATDPTARTAADAAQQAADAAQQAANTALTQIIPGTRLAADAIDGKTITGATFRTAGAGLQRVQIDSASGLVGYNSAGVPVTTIGTDGRLSTSDATVTGSFTAQNSTNGGVIVDGITPAVGNGVTGAGVRWNSGRTGSKDATLVDQTLTLNGTPNGRRIRLTAGAAPGYTGTVPLLDFFANNVGQTSTLSLSADAISLAAPTVTLFAAQGTDPAAVVRRDYVDALRDGTGWTDCTTRTGFTVQNATTPQVRRVGNVVFMRWGWSGTGMTASAAQSVGDIPAGFRPAQDHYFRPGVNTAAVDVQGVVFATGVCEVRTGATLPAYALFSTCWLIN